MEASFSPLLLRVDLKKNQGLDPAVPTFYSKLGDACWRRLPSHFSETNMMKHTWLALQDALPLSFLL
jgi:hypothetical protein